MSVEGASPILAEVDASVAELTGAVVDRLRSLGDVAAVGIVGRPYDLPDSLERILASHSLLHAAEGDLYLSALLDAADDRGLPSILAPPKGTVAAVAPELGTTADALASCLARLRADLGAPWTADHKAATAAALLALSTA
jgi:hypothetical protein